MTTLTFITTHWCETLVVLFLAAAAYDMNKGKK